MNDDLLGTDVDDGQGPARSGAWRDSLYLELHDLARARMRGEASGATLQPTALVHEVWLRLQRDHSAPWGDRAAFLRAAAGAMRRILIDRVRQRRRLKRGEGVAANSIDAIELPEEERSIDIEALNEALEELERRDPRKAEVVSLVHLAGCSLEEAAQALGVSLATVKRDWSFARAWLLRVLSKP